MLPVVQNDRPLPRGSARALLRAMIAPALTLTLVACSNTQAPPEPSAANLPPTTIEVDAGRILAAMLSPTDEGTAAAMIAALPAPVSSTTRTVPNLHAPGVTDQVSELAFGDVTVEVYRPSSGSRPLLTGVELVNPTIDIDGFRVGMSAADLRQRLGRPSVATDDLLVYRMAPSKTAPYELSASLVDGVVTLLRWSAYLD